MSKRAESSTSGQLHPTPAACWWLPLQEPDRPLETAPETKTHPSDVRTSREDAEELRPAVATATAIAATVVASAATAIAATVAAAAATAIAATVAAAAAVAATVAVAVL